MAHSPKDHFFQFQLPESSPVQPVKTFAFPVHFIDWVHEVPPFTVLSTTGWPNCRSRRVGDIDVGSAHGDKHGHIIRYAVGCHDPRPCSSIER
jgi:hypothetical protein